MFLYGQFYWRKMIRHQQIKKLKPSFVKEKLKDFFIEDQTHKDLTTLFFTNSSATVRANLVAKEKLNSKKAYKLTLLIILVTQLFNKTKKTNLYLHILPQNY